MHQTKMLTLAVVSAVVVMGFIVATAPAEAGSGLSDRVAALEAQNAAQQAEIDKAQLDILAHERLIMLLCEHVSELHDVKDICNLR